MWVHNYIQIYYLLVKMMPNWRLKTKLKIMPEEKPPILKSWNQIYLFVLIFQIVLVILFTLFTKKYA